jgi:hypothetical protein
MSNFFGNLIGRHKELGLGSNAIPIVEPRPKARYEAESEVPNEPLAEQQLSVPANTSAGEELLRNPESTLPILNQNPNSQRQSNSLDPIDDKETPRSVRSNEKYVSEHSENSTTLPLNGILLNRFSIPERNNSDDQRPGLLAKEPGTDDHESNRGALAAEDLDLRVQSILNRLRLSEENHKGVSEEFSVDRKAMLTTDSENLNPTHSEQNDPSSKERFDELSLNQKNNKSMQEAPGEPGSLKTNQEGQLNIPGWLADMQSDINKRWQHINAKIESTKPVVNVTIGRVEVRAAHDTGLQAPGSQKKAQKKPSGVMSLNDYLKSRDKEERA